MMRQIPLSVLLVIFAIPTSSVGQEAVVSNATHESAAQLMNNAAALFPSPFTGNFGTPPVKFVGNSDNVKDLVAPKAKKTSKHISIEVRTLVVDLDTSSNILNIVGLGNLSYSSGEIKPTWKPENEPADPNGEFASGQTATIQAHPISYAQITDDKYLEIVSLLKSNPRSQMTEAPTIATYENVPATISDSASVPFVVSVKPVVNETSVAMQPEIQLIEEGTIFEFLASVTDSGVQLKTHMISNQITNVDTFTFEGSGNVDAATIQLPTCKCTQIHLANEIKKDHLMLVDTNIVREQEIRSETGILNRIVGNSKLEQYKTKTMLIIRASVVD